MDNGLVFKNVHKAIKLNREVWLKPPIDMNTELWKNTKTKKQNKKNKKKTRDFQKDFFKLMNNTFFGKTMEKVIQHRDRDINLATNKSRRNYLMLEPNCPKTNRFKKCISNRSVRTRLPYNNLTLKK